MGTTCNEIMCKKQRDLNETVTYIDSNLKWQLHKILILNQCIEWHKAEPNPFDIVINSLYNHINKIQNDVDNKIATESFS